MTIPGGCIMYRCVILIKLEAPVVVFAITYTAINVKIVFNFLNTYITFYYYCDHKIELGRLCFPI